MARVARASLTATGGRLEAGEREQAGARGLEVGGLGGRPGEEVARRGVAGDRAVAHGDDAVGGAEAALEPVLGEDDGRPPLLVEPPQDAEQLVAGDGVELRRRLVEQHERAAAWPAPRRAPRAAARRRTARRSSGRAGAAMPSASAASSTPRATAAAREPAVLEREGELGAHRAHHDLRLGLLEQRPGHRGELGRAVLARVEPADHARGRRTSRRGSAGRGRRRRAAASTCRSRCRRRARRTRPARRRARRRAAPAAPAPG